MSIPPASLCIPLKPQDPHAFALCEERLRAGDRKHDLDIGTDRLDYSDPKGPRRIWESQPHDNAISPQEIYRRQVDLVEKEEKVRAQVYLKNLKAPPAFESKLLRDLKERGATQLPFIFEDLDPKTRDDEIFFRIALKKIQQTQNSLAIKGIYPESANYQEQMALALFAWIRRPRIFRGLGIKYVDRPPYPAKNLGQIFSLRKASCLEFTYLFLALGRLARLNVIPIEVFRNTEGQLILHNRIGVLLRHQESLVTKSPVSLGKPQSPKRLSSLDGKETDILFLDIADGLAGKRLGEVWWEISRLDLIALYYNDFGVLNRGEKAKSHFEKALRYAPSHYLVRTNLGFWHLKVMQDGENGLREFLEAKRDNPQFPFLYKGLEIIYRAKGLPSEADLQKQIYDRLLRLPKNIK